jgi:hypothetical protein
MSLKNMALIGLMGIVGCQSVKYEGSPIEIQHEEESVERYNLENIYRNIGECRLRMIEDEKALIRLERIVEFRERLDEMERISGGEEIFLRIYDDGEINAKSLRAYRIVYVSERMLVFVENSDEIAAVAAHEVSHFNDEKIEPQYIFTRSGRHEIPKRLLGEPMTDCRAADYLYEIGYSPYSIRDFVARMYKEGEIGRLEAKARMDKLEEYLCEKYPE